MMRYIFLIISFLLLHTSNINAFFNRYRAYNAYQRGDFDVASKLLQKELIYNPHDATILFDLGDASYRLGEYDKAIAYFLPVSDTCNNETLRIKALFNIGNSYIGQKKLKDAIIFYDKVLSLVPDHNHALHNKKVVEELLRQKEQQEKQKKDQQDKNNKENNSEEKMDTENQQENENDKSKNQSQDKNGSNGEESNQDLKDGNQQHSADANDQPRNKNNNSDQQKMNNQNTNNNDNHQNANSQDENSSEKGRQSQNTSDEKQKNNSIKNNIDSNDANNNESDESNISEGEQANDGGQQNNGQQGPENFDKKSDDMLSTEQKPITKDNYKKVDDQEKYKDGLNNDLIDSEKSDKSANDKDQKKETNFSKFEKNTASDNLHGHNDEKLKQHQALQAEAVKDVGNEVDPLLSDKEVQLLQFLDKNEGDVHKKMLMQKVKQEMSHEYGQKNW